MTLDEAVALSLIDNLPRQGLTGRLLAGDPELIEIARAFRDRARLAQDAAARSGIRALRWSDPRYPAGLLAIPDCPPVLWYRGDLVALDAPAVAIVGSRAASTVALEIASQLASDLAAHGIVVVSGLARGVDSAAHRGALATGRTMAVLGSGLDRVYPAEHVALAETIATAGLVVSEYPPGTTPLPRFFPERNRVISGLSRAVVVIEASEKSGSLITASRALEQGREVMAVPGNVLSGRNRGGHALIRDGATIVERADDILEQLGLLPALTRPSEPAASDGASIVCRDPVLRAMTSGEAYELDALSAASGVPLHRLLGRVSELELRGLVERLDGGRFVRRDRTC